MLNNTAVGSVRCHVTRLIEHPEPLPFIHDEPHVFGLIEQLGVSTHRIAGKNRMDAPRRC